MNDVTFTNINRLSVQLFKAGENHPTRNTFNTYYMSLVEIKAFNVLTKNKPFFDKLLKNKQEVYEKPAEMSRNDYYKKTY